jgi:rSAM/selenodomain-associated transferase 1
MERRVSDVLYIAAKAPRPGLCKTRLAQTIGDDAALALYRAFLQDLATRFADAPFPVGWYVTPADGWPELARIVGPSDRVVEQGEGDWTERQRWLFATAAARGESRVVLVASDSPQLPVAAVQQAFDALDRNELVFGPTHDGGYYLIGMRALHDVLSGVRMSTGTVLDELIGRAEARGLSVGLVETLFDVDEAADLAQLARLAEAREDLPATRAALAQVLIPA